MSGRLNGSCEAIGSIDHPVRRRLYELFSRNYADVSFFRFEQDFEEKQFAILLHDETGEIRGFSTVAVWDRTIQGSRTRLLFSGDTIIDGAYRGEQALGKAWSFLAGQLSAADLLTPFFWLLLSKGYRTYLYLPLFFHQYYPRPELPAPAWAKGVIDDFGLWKYGTDYDAGRGVISFATPHGRLRPELAAIPEHRRGDRHVRFFLERNPGWRDGDELVCLARLDAMNMKGYARGRFLAGWESVAPLSSLEGIA